MVQYGPWKLISYAFKFPGLQGEEGVSPFLVVCDTLCPTYGHWHVVWYCMQGNLTASARLTAYQEYTLAAILRGCRRKTKQQ